VKWSELFDKMLEKKAEEIKKQRRSNRKPGDRWTPEEIEFGLQKRNRDFGNSWLRG